MATADSAATATTAAQEKRRAEVVANLEAKQQARQEDYDKRRVASAAAASREESVTEFWKEFNRLKEEVTAALARCASIESAGLAAHFEAVAQTHQAMSQMVVNSFIASYEIKTAEEIVKQLGVEISTNRSTYLPDKAFSFKSRNKGKAKAAAATEPAVAGESNATATTTTATTTTTIKPTVPDSIISGLRSETRIIDRTSSFEGRDVTVSDAQDSTIYLLHRTPAVRLLNLQRCRVITGPVSGSVYIEGCADCVLVLACHQLRMHTTQRTDLYLHVTSVPIIEDCTAIRVAPNTAVYPEHAQQFEAAGIRQDVNKWSTVNDFKWLHTDVPSPHWAVLPEAERAPVDPQGVLGRTSATTNAS